MKTPSSFAYVLLGLSVAACGVSVHPDDGQGRDATVGEASSSDASATIDGENPSTVCLPLRFGCMRGDAGPCPAECSDCVGILVHRGPPEDLNWRQAQTACATRVPLRGPPAPYFNGWVGCNEPWELAYSWGDRDRQSRCLLREQCLAIVEATPRVGADETVRRCLSADGTTATRARVPSVGVCEPNRGLCSADRACMCPDGTVCAFLSDLDPAYTGVCVRPSTGFDAGQSQPCRGGANRVACPSGEGCVVPLRRDVGMRDEDRWGVCVAPEQCRYAAMRALYACDLSSVQDAGG
jgi:hypothetical protein